MSIVKVKDPNTEQWIKVFGSKNGKSAYQLAVENGYSGTLAEWLASLQGEDGADGNEIYIGTVQPSASEGYKLWINPDEAPSSGGGGGASGMELLWTNSDGNSVSMPQTEVTVDTSGYSGIAVTFYTQRGYSSTVTQTVMKGGTGRLFVGTYDNGVLFYDRAVTWTDNGVEFGDGYSNGAKDNGKVLPWKIWGVV